VTARGWIVGLLITLASVAPAAAQGRGGSGGGGTTPAGAFERGRLGMLEDAFVLKKEQTKQIKTILDDAAKSAAPVREQLAKTRAAIADAIHARKPQPEIDAAVNTYAAQASAMMAIEMKAMANVMQSLETEQRANTGAVSTLFFLMRAAFLESKWDNPPGTRLY
jgi:Heavy-metal resistance